jgi:hypothetical protein
MKKLIKKKKKSWLTHQTRLTHQTMDQTKKLKKKFTFHLIFSI